MREPPLTDSELRVLRGMIDEYRVGLELGAARRREWSTAKTITVTVAGLALVSLQIASVILGLVGR